MTLFHEMSPPSHSFVARSVPLIPRKQPFIVRIHTLNGVRTSARHDRIRGVACSQRRTASAGRFNGALTAKQRDRLLLPSSYGRPGASARIEVSSRSHAPSPSPERPEQRLARQERIAVAAASDARHAALARIARAMNRDRHPRAKRGEWNVTDPAGGLPTVG